MRARKVLLISALVIAILIAAALIIRPLLPKNTISEEEEETDKIPENGVHYEYSKGGNSERVISRTTYENSVAVSVDTYEYWQTGEIKTITTTAGGKVTDIWNYSFSEGSILAQMVHQSFEGENEYTDDYRYNEKGIITGVTSTINGKANGGVRYTYDKDDLLILEENLDPNGDTVTYTEYSYNESKEIARSDFYQFGSLFTSEVYEYDEKKLLSITKYSGESVLSKETYTYDPDGRLTRINKLDPKDTLVGYTECLYDETGFHYRDIYYENGKTVYRYEYNKDGIPVYKAY